MENADLMQALSERDALIQDPERQLKTMQMMTNPAAAISRSHQSQE
jgi:hypothetical protein